jgi:acetyl-CoA carboxylase biotin carboxyl carrier protein
VNIEEIERLVRLVAETDLGEVEVRHGGAQVRIARHPPAQPGAPVHVMSMPHAQGPGWTAAPPPLPHGGMPAAPPAPVDDGLHVIPSSMVGTFYRRPNPEAPPFAKEGDTVKKGQVICILEAMKILNEIESDVSGTVVKVFPEDGQPVEFGEKLFAIRPA